TVAVITNIDREHLDFYHTFDAIKDSFVRFANSVPFYGFVSVCADNDAVREILPRIERRVITYGITGDLNYVARNISLDVDSSSFDVYKNGKLLGRVKTALRGMHNVLNSLATISVGDELMIPFEKISCSLSNFKGIARRFQIKGQKDGVLVIDDYGHHPTEIQATLKTVELLNRKRIFVIFQPHRYTRTRDLMNDFADVFKDTKDLLLMEIYSAQEMPIEGIDSNALLNEIRRRGNRSARFFSNNDEILRYLKHNASEGDVILTIGAGSVYKIGEDFLKGE
ncbi:MAG: UDP-N-acetylmuramate--L-alanine ligase, partial [Myxococcota bacterium]